MVDVVLYGHAQDEATGTCPAIVGDGWCTVLQGGNAVTHRAPDRYEVVVWEGVPLSGTVADARAFFHRQIAAGSVPSDSAAEPKGGKHA